MNEAIAVSVLVFPLVVTIAAAHDLLTMTIPNRLSLILVGAFFAAALMSGMAPATLALNVGVGVGVLAATFTLFAFGIIGGGDAKLAAAIALWLGVDQGFVFLVVAALYGGALSIGILLFRVTLLPSFALRQNWIVRLHEPTEGIPYGIALAAGAMTVFPSSHWFGFLTALPS